MRWVRPVRRELHRLPFGTNRGTGQRGRAPDVFHAGLAKCQ